MVLFLFSISCLLPQLRHQWPAEWAKDSAAASRINIAPALHDTKWHPGEDQEKGATSQETPAYAPQTCDTNEFASCPLWHQWSPGPRSIRIHHCQNGVKRSKMVTTRWIKLTKEHLRVWIQSSSTALGHLHHAVELSGLVPSLSSVSSVPSPLRSSRQGVAKNQRLTGIGSCIAKSYEALRATGVCAKGWQVQAYASICKHANRTSWTLWNIVESKGIFEMTPMTS